MKTHQNIYPLSALCGGSSGGGGGGGGSGRRRRRGKDIRRMKKTGFRPLLNGEGHFISSFILVVVCEYCVDEGGDWKSGESSVVG